MATKHFSNEGLLVQLRLIPADDEPTLADGQACIWVDTNDSDRQYLVSRYAGVQVKIELV